MPAFHRPPRPNSGAILARRHAKEAIAALVLALDDPAHRVAAAKALLERAYGPIPDPYEEANPGDAMTTEELEAGITWLRRRMGRDPSGGNTNGVKPFTYFGAFQIQG